MTHSTYDNPEIQAALAALRKQKWPQQYETIRSLAESQSASADMVLLHLLDNRSPEVREAALKDLRERNEVLGRIAARAALDDTSSFVRNAAAEILGEVGSRLDVRRLTHALQDSDWVVRASAADSLGYIGGKAAHPALKKAMRQDTQSIVRRDAAFALAYAKAEEVIPDLEQALVGEKEEQTQVGLLSALYALGQRERLPAILELLQSYDYHVRYAVINSLLDIVRPDDIKEAVRAIHAMLVNESSAGLRIDGAKAVERLSGLLPSGDI